MCPIVFRKGSEGRKPETEASYGVMGTVLSFPAQTRVTGSFRRKDSACCAGGGSELAAGARAAGVQRSEATAALWQGA